MTAHEICSNFRQQASTWSYAYVALPYNMLYRVRHHMNGMSAQAWPRLPSHTQPLMSTPQEGQAPSQGAGQGTSPAAAAAPEAAAGPPTTQDNPRNGKSVTDSRTNTNVWADPGAAKVWGSKSSGLKRPTPSAKSPSMPAKPKNSVLAQTFSLFLNDLSPVGNRPSLCTQGDLSNWSSLPPQQIL